MFSIFFFFTVEKNVWCGFAIYSLYIKIKQVNPKGNPPWILTVRIDTEAEPSIGPLMQRADLFKKTLMLGKIEGRRRRGWQRMRWLNGITDSMDMSLSRLRDWRRKWQPTPVFFPGESQGWGSLVGCRLWGRTESDTTEVTQQQQQQQQQTPGVGDGQGGLACCSPWGCKE